MRTTTKIRSGPARAIGKRFPGGLVATAGVVGMVGLVFAVAVIWTVATPGPAGAHQPKRGEETGYVRPDLSAKFDLNRATLDEVMSLPIPEMVARKIVDYRTFVRYFDNIYDLMEVDGMTPELLSALKPLAATLPPDALDASIARLSASYRQARRFLGQEGASEGLVDEYLDMIRDPANANDLDLFDLMSFQNVSPVDATNILKARDRLGRFENSRQLRRSDGLRYWAYRNLRDFVVYSEAERNEGRADRIRGSYEIRYYDTPYFSDDDELSSFALNQAAVSGGSYAVAEQELARPSMTNKLRLDLTRGMRAGVLTHRNLGERYWDETVKGFYGVEDKDLGPVRIKRAYVGDFRVAFGLGLVMDNTDYFLYRKTGFGWNKRPIGVRGDLSRSREFGLRGAAVESRVGQLHATVFAASGRKDGIVNADGTINQYVLMQPRPQQEFLDKHLTTNQLPTGLKRDAFTEDIFGGNVKYLVAPGTFVGLTGYEARYNKAFRADVATLVDRQDLLEARDAEISQSYTSVFDTGLGLEAYKFRRVVGAEFQTVYNNLAVQGEYAVLQDPRNGLLDADNPNAYIVNAFTQWDNLHLLAIYRDYDLGFDNPYNRAFANDNRYEMTLLDAPYRLNDDLYTWLELNTPQPKPEKGVFFDARYRISRNLILSGLQFDQWTRKADGADMQRYTVKGEYQPIFNLRLRVRHRYSSRTENNPDDVRTYQNWETRWQLISLLSNYNRLAFMYMTSNVFFPARQRLSGPAEAGDVDSAVGTAALPAHAFEARYEHNLTPWLRLQFASLMYDGFLWNFEGNEFVLLDGTGFRNWFKVETRVSERMLLQLKITRDHNLPRTYIDVREYGGPAGPDPEATYVPQDNTLVRFQLDYTF